MPQKIFRFLVVGLMAGIISLAGLMLLQTLIPLSPANHSTDLIQTALATSTVTAEAQVGNAAPTVTVQAVNEGSDVTLTASSTTNVVIRAQISDSNGCGDISGGTTTILYYRFGITSSTCKSTPDNLNCYRATAFDTSSTCSSNSINTTTTFAVQYFAQATDASSSFPTQTWYATVEFTDGTGGANSTGTDDINPPNDVETNTLVAVSVATSTIQYGSVAAGANTGATNQSATSSNAGNSSTTLKLNCTAMSFSGNNNATTSQHYATSTFTYGGSEQACQPTTTDVAGSLMTSPTSTAGVLRSMFWGVAIDAGLPPGTYTGTDTYGGAWSP